MAAVRHHARLGGLDRVDGRWCLNRDLERMMVCPKQEPKKGHWIRALVWNEITSEWP